MRGGCRSLDTDRAQIVLSPFEFRDKEDLRARRDWLEIADLVDLAVDGDGRLLFEIP